MRLLNNGVLFVSFFFVMLLDAYPVSLRRLIKCNADGAVEKTVDIVGNAAVPRGEFSETENSFLSFLQQLNDSGKSVDIVWEHECVWSLARNVFFRLCGTKSRSFIAEFHETIRNKNFNTVRLISGDSRSAYWRWLEHLVFLQSEYRVHSIEEKVAFFAVYVSRHPLSKMEVQELFDDGELCAEIVATTIAAYPKLAAMGEIWQAKFDALRKRFGKLDKKMTIKDLFLERDLSCVGDLIRDMNNIQVDLGFLRNIFFSKRKHQIICCDSACANNLALQLVGDSGYSNCFCVSQQEHIVTRDPFCKLLEEEKIIWPLLPLIKPRIEQNGSFFSDNVEMLLHTKELSANAWSLLLEDPSVSYNRSLRGELVNFEFAPLADSKVKTKEEMLAYEITAAYAKSEKKKKKRAAIAAAAEAAEIQELLSRLAATRAALSSVDA